MWKLLAVALIVLASAPIGFTPAAACSAETDCVIGDRYYRIRMPEGHDNNRTLGALIYAHGYRGSAKGMMNNRSMAKLASELGVALVATKSYGEDWRIPGVPRNTGTDGKLELDYFDALVADLEQRFSIDADRLVVTGFSAGGMMVWNLVCHRGSAFAGFIPMSGTFWEPEPDTCTSPPANVVHIHGDADRIVPLLGRPIADTHQGQVPQVLEMYEEYGNYRFSSREKHGELDCRKTTNLSGKILNFCLFPGGHSFKTEYVREAWRQLSNTIEP